MTFRICKQLWSADSRHFIQVLWFA
jgi:hypothetical protein